MILHTHSDASYLSEPKARSRAGGIHYLSNRQYDNVDNINGAILVISQIMKNVLSSAAEAELGALFINCVDAVAIRTMLTELGHQTASHASANRQFHRRRHRQSYRQTTTIKSHRHAVLLAARLRRTRSFQHILVMRHRQSCRLLHEASPAITSSCQKTSLHQ